MKSKNFGFLLLVGLIAPSAVMSVESSFNTVSPETEGLVLKKKRALEDRLSALSDRATDLLTIHNKGDNPHPLNEPGGDLSREYLSSLTLKICKFFENTSNFEKKFKSDIEEYFQAYVKLNPDAWDEDLVEFYTSSRIKFFLKLQAIEDAAKESFKEFPDPMQPSIKSRRNNWCYFIKGIDSIKKLLLSNDNNEFNDLMKKMQLSTENVKEIADFQHFKKEKVDPIIEQEQDLINENACSVDNEQSDNNTNSFDNIMPEKMKQYMTKCIQLTVEDHPSFKEDDFEDNETQKQIEDSCCKKHPFLVDFFKAESISKKRLDQEEEKHMHLLHFFKCVGGFDSTRLCPTQEKILNSIEDILNYIENSQL